MENIRIIFMGTPKFGVPILKALIDNYHLVGVITQPDKSFNISPIKKLALEFNLPLFQPEDITKEEGLIKDLNPDLIITCAYGQFISKNTLDYPKFGCLNVHASLLPKLRGGAPLHRAIINGYHKTGVTIMKTILKMDAGDIISQIETEIKEDDTVGTLHDRLSLLGRDLLIKTLPKIIKGEVKYLKQDHSLATYAPILTKNDEKIDFNKNKREIINLIRGLNPYPGAYALLDNKVYKIWKARMGENGFMNYLNGEIIKIYDDGLGVKVGNGEIIIEEIQVEGKKRLAVKDFLNGLQNKETLIGKVFQ
ncbi:MAG: methionyl-tRNA formyltransferase [Bacilli bacterium]